MIVCGYCNERIYPHGDGKLRHACARPGDKGCKPITPTKGEPMPQTREYWEKRASRDQELIMEMNAEISALKSQLNNCRQKLEAYRK